MLPPNVKFWEFVNVCGVAWQFRTATEFVKNQAGFDVPIVGSRPCSIDRAAAIQSAVAFGIEPDKSFMARLATFETACLSYWQAEQRCGKQQKAKCKVQFGKYLEATCKKCERKADNR